MSSSSHEEVKWKVENRTLQDTCHKVEQVKTKKHSVPNKSDFRGSSLTWNNSGKIGQISE